MLIRRSGAVQVLRATVGEMTSNGQSHIRRNVRLTSAAVLLAVALAASAISGCGGGNGSVDSNPKSAPPLLPPTDTSPAIHHAPTRTP